MTEKPLDELVRDAIAGGYYTADGERVMLSIDQLVALELLSPVDWGSMALAACTYRAADD